MDRDKVEKSQTERSDKVDYTEDAIEGDVGDSDLLINSYFDDSEDEQCLSKSMQGVSLYYDPKRKAVIKGQKEDGVELRASSSKGEGNQKLPKVKSSHKKMLLGI